VAHQGQDRPAEREARRTERCPRCGAVHEVNPVRALFVRAETARDDAVHAGRTSASLREELRVLAEDPLHRRA